MGSSSESEPFKPHWWAWVIFGLTIALFISDGFLRVLSDPGNIAVTLPRLAGSLLCPLLLTLVAAKGAYRLFRRSRLAGSIGMVAVQGLFWLIAVLNFIGVASEARGRHAAHQQMDSALTETRQAIVAAQQSESGDLAGGEVLDPVIAGLRQIRDTSPPEERAGFDALIAVMQKVGVQRSNYTELFNQSNDEGLFDLGTVSSLDSINGRLQRLKELHGLAGELHRVNMEIEGELRRELAARSVPEGRAREFVGGFLSSRTPESRSMANRLNEITKENLECWGYVYRLLAEQWGKWEYNTESQYTAFDESVPDAVIGRFNEISQKMDELVAEEARLTQVLLNSAD